MVLKRLFGIGRKQLSCKFKGRIVAHGILIKRRYRLVTHAVVIVTRIRIIGFHGQTHVGKLVLVIKRHIGVIAHTTGGSTIF